MQNLLHNFSSLPVRAGLIAVVAFFFAFPNPILQMPLLILLFPAVLFWQALTAVNYKKAFVRCTLTAFLANSISLYWLTIPLHEYAGVPWLLGAWMLAILGMYIGFFVAPWALFSRFFARSLPLPLVVLGSALLWGALEYVRGFLFTGFPWFSLSSAFAGMPLLAQGADTLGMYGLSAFYVAVALCFDIGFILQRNSGAVYRTGVITKRLFTALGCFLLLASGFYGYLRVQEFCPPLELTPLPASDATSSFSPAGSFNATSQNTPSNSGSPKKPANLDAFGSFSADSTEFFDEFAGEELVNNTLWPENAVVITFMQGNINQAQKFDPALQQSTVDKYIDLSKGGIELALQRFGRKPDMQLWPETAAPFYFQISETLAQDLRRFTRNERIPLLFGVPGRGVRLSELGDYNRVWLLNRNGADAGTYDKMHLVPLGEYIPLALQVPFLDSILQGFGFKAGKDHSPIRSDAMAMGILLCYEAIFPELAQARVAHGANILINLSNDGWFGKSSAPYQHLQLSAMRAIEQRRYIARCTNTGVSAMITPTGQVYGASPLYVEHVQAETALLLDGFSFFHRHYNLITYLLLVSPLVFILAATAGCIRNRRNAAVK